MIDEQKMWRQADPGGRLNIAFGVRSIRAMDTKDRAYNYGIAAMLTVAALIGLWALYEAHQPNPPVLLPTAPVAAAPEPVPSAPRAAPPVEPQAVVIPDSAAYPPNAGEPDAEASFKAGLAAGDAKAVVLLVSVLDDDELSSIDIEISSGSKQADTAAMNYVRSLHWVAARKQGKVAKSVVRYVVRFHR